MAAQVRDQLIAATARSGQRSKVWAAACFDEYTARVSNLQAIE
jgi:hypothetical protein